MLCLDDVCSIVHRRLAMVQCHYCRMKQILTLRCYQQKSDAFLPMKTSVHIVPSVFLHVLLHSVGSLSYALFDSLYGIPTSDFERTSGSFWFSTGRSTVTCQTLREPESHPDILINLFTGLHRMYTICSWTLYGLERKGCRDSCMAHLNQVNHAASTAPSKSQGWKHLLTWQKHTKFKCGKGGVVAAATSLEIVFRRALSSARCRYDVFMDIVLGHFSCWWYNAEN